MKGTRLTRLLFPSSSASPCPWSLKAVSPLSPFLASICRGRARAPIVVGRKTPRSQHGVTRPSSDQNKKKARALRQEAARRPKATRTGMWSVRKQAEGREGGGLEKKRRPIRSNRFQFVSPPFFSRIAELTRKRRITLLAPCVFSLFSGCCGKVPMVTELVRLAVGSLGSWSGGQGTTLSCLVLLVLLFASNERGESRIQSGQSKKTPAGGCTKSVSLLGSPDALGCVYGYLTEQCSPHFFFSSSCLGDTKKSDERCIRALSVLSFTRA